MKASSTRPADVDFVRSDAVTEFALFVEADMSWTRPIHLGRRWFGFRGGVEVDTGLATGPTF